MRGHRVARCEVNRQLCHVAINRITINSVSRISCSSPYAPLNRENIQVSWLLFRHLHGYYLYCISKRE